MIYYNARNMLLATATAKVFWTSVLPLAALACVWFAVLFFYRGLRLLLLRVRFMRGGLHASGVLPRPHAESGTCYVPVFSYTTHSGDEVDILGCEEYPTEEAAMQARRPLVYAGERPDAAMAVNAASYLARPVLMIAASVVLVEAAHYLLLYMPD